MPPLAETRMIPSRCPNRMVPSVAQLAPNGIVAAHNVTGVPPLTLIFFSPPAAEIAHPFAVGRHEGGDADGARDEPGGQFAHRPQVQAILGLVHEASAVGNGRNHRPRRVGELLSGWQHVVESGG